MNTECSNCATNFEKEPGFFYGAMYVSYALAIAESVGIFILCQLFFERFLDPAMIIFILAGIALFSTTNYKLSRVIWVYLFIKKPKV